MDGGRIIYALDRGLLRDLKFSTYSFENSSQGKFILNIIFGDSTYYVDSLSENLKRGQGAKIRNGWMPNRAAIGYRHCRESQRMVPEPKNFNVVRDLFDLLLTGRYSVSEIYRIACEDWGYMARYSHEQLTYGTIAPGVARRLLDAGRVDEALGIVIGARAVEDGKSFRMLSYSLDEVYQECLERLGRTDELKTHVWSTFRETLSAPVCNST
ncbi:hypothetical protein SPO2408 [Ruegeria pomeroyi DSS-3]|uniref:Uncharacterized protein n=2 Tax=Ruegeria pomeroyi TaxID=89184 RepID=Q5LQT0_RUEPO|nr:DUF6880 family protein [Ruegeria pomeroyi]AAV95662.1 hypothetical protein SPO2408 [Ruegeria pomeroyi DSS-3]NVK99017.1 hypothetical protein [Ruegeria pomeroyi]NVL03059.1 hypothetical protein [Ruegeria pomeroyi]HCE71206.1 hypothetical protein [Ruegeria sp.]